MACTVGTMGIGADPAMMLAQLLAGMKDEEGRVLVPHFYDGIAPLTKIELEALARAPVNDSNAYGLFLARTCRWFREASS